MSGKTPPPHAHARLFTLALLALALSAPSWVFARQQPTQEPNAKSLTHTEDGSKVVILPDRAKRYAVVIGIDKYTSDTNIPTLHGAANDAQAIADALVEHAGFERDKVVLLTSNATTPGGQPTRANIGNVLAQLKNKVEEGGMLVVAFSGHGVERKSDRQVFLLPSDAYSDPDQYDWSAIPVNLVTALIKQTKAHQVMLLLDSCRNDPSGGKGTEDNNLTRDSIDAWSVRNGSVKAFVTLYAASEGQRAWEYQDKKQGYFSWAFVQGLKGGARDPETGELTLGRLIEYVQKEVPRSAKMFSGKEQKPHVVMDGYGSNLIISKVEPAPKPVVRNAAPAVIAPPAPTTGTLSIVSEPGARITIEPLAGGKAVEGVANGEGVYNSGPLNFGDYRITAALEGSVPDSKQEKIAANKLTAVVPLKLKEATYTLTVSANVASGSVSVGTKGGATTLVPLKDGRAVAPGLRPGEYVVTINPDDVSYPPETEPVTVNGDREHRFTLKSRLRQAPYDAQFDVPGHWRLPAGWRATPALEVNGEGRVLLNEEFGRFKDFELSANVELVGGKSVSFIVRAVDEQNYYLVRLSGPRAETPNTLNLFLVKNGQKPRSIYDVSLRGYKLNDQFVFAIKVSGSQFNFLIDDNSYNNINKPIGLSPVGAHPDNTFAVGGVGVAAGPGDKAKIFQFLVCPGSCAQN